MASQTAADRLSFADFIKKVNPRYQFYKHCEALIDVLQRVADGEITRLMVFMPPRHSKSQTVSRLFSAYYLYRYPERFVGINSYAADLAYTLSRNARENYLQAGGVLRGDARAVKHWETQSGGGMWAAGVGGPITGKGGHLLIIDDPLKNAEESESVTIREKQKDWYESTLSTREEPGGAIVIVQTRWHADDLSGWLLSLEDEDDADATEHWHIVSLEAIKEETPPEFPASCTLEPDWRQPGEALCPERYPLEKLEKRRARLGGESGYFWNALFQQRPRAREGSMFKEYWFQIVPAAPAIARRVRYWDKAGVQDGGDYTVGVLMARTPEGLYYVEDVKRGQWSAHNRDEMIKQTAEFDRARYQGTVTTYVEQEPGFGKEATEDIIRKLAGYVAYADPVRQDKEPRAQPFAAQCEAGNVRLVAGAWNRTYIEEHCAFPKVAHEDQVDASSGAFNKLALGTEFYAAVGGKRDEFKPR